MNSKDKKINRSTLVRLAGYVSAQKAILWAMVISVVIGTVFGVLAPGIQSRAIDIIAGTEEGVLMKTLGLMMFVYILYAISKLLQGLLSAKLSQKLTETLRGQLFSKITDLPVGYLDRHSHGDVMSRMTNDIDNISMSVSQSLPSLISGIFTILGTLAAMFWYCWQLTILSCSTVILTIMVTKFLSKKVRKNSRIHQKQLGNLNGIIEEKISGFSTVVAYNRQHETIREFNETSEVLTTASIKTNIAAGALGPMNNAINNICFVIIAAFGGLFSLNGMISVGVISAFIVYAKQFARPINELANIYGQLQTAMAGAERVFALMDTESEDMSGKDLEKPDHPAVEFQNVSFSYDGEKKVLEDFSLTIPSGKKVALVGHTGSGKTTVVNLLMRFYDPSQGKILINGQDIAEVSRDVLRKEIAIVLQDATLFTDTVRNNLVYANENASEEQIREAAELSHCREMIENLPLGYDTVLTGAGSNLSQGQRQLLTIARAFIADPNILVLDEATSNVDTRTEKAIQDAMHRVMENRTSIVIAHRLSTIRDADIIIVMDHGKIVEQGSHDELIALKGSYYDLYTTQFEGFAT